MLDRFIATHRDEIITRCRAKVAVRSVAVLNQPDEDYGVPLFLDQLIEALRLGGRSSPEIGESAIQHGRELLRKGFTVSQVVHDYGDVCQAVTDMAVEQEAVVSADEFRTLNRCLDNAIADAVTAYARDSQAMINEQAEAIGDRLTLFSQDHERLLDLAIQSFAAIQTGNIGATGATGMAHRSNLIALRILVQQFMPQIRLASAKTTLSPGGGPPKA